MKRIMRQTAVCTAAAMLCAAAAVPQTAHADYGVGGNGTAVMEYLDRGIYAVRSGSGMFVSWRWNADDADSAEFRLYRDDTLVYTSQAGTGATCYQDNGGSTNSVYRVDTVVSGKVVNSETCKFLSGTNYFDIPLDVPQGGVIKGEAYSYSPNDTVVGDVDGDGQYELFVKWDPSNSKDNSQVTDANKGIQGITGNVYIDCYTLTGQKLWRIDMGRNIRAGQHYTQMCVADFDCDGKAELITKTCDGTIDGTGRVIGDGSKVYVTDAGTILTGPEYMTLFEGATGKALDTIDFPVPRGDATSANAKNTWRDNYGNRCERYNSAIAYLDGVHPSAIYGRGYYTRLTLSAVDVVNGKLSKRWIFDTGFDPSAPGYGCGNHNVMVADSDNDGRQEIFMGACAIDDNGKLLWSTGQMHGDAMHLGDLDPDRAGLELWICHEDKPYGVSLVDAKNGQIIFHKDADKDTGRCCGDNIFAGNRGAELWGSRPANTVMNTKGNAIGSTQPSQNFLIYWDGDLERELLDGNTITKMTALNSIKTLLTAEGCSSNNSTKAVPCCTADLFGDWREELILRTNDNSRLRIWCTTAQTDVRLTTLMHDMQYRMQDCCQQSAYNQPPHVSYYLGSEAPLPERPNVVINGKTIGGDRTVSVDTSKVYTLRNSNSSLLMGLDGSAADGVNVSQQSGAAGDADRRWQFEATEDGSYMIRSAADSSLALSITADSDVVLQKATGADNQKFILIRSGANVLVTPASSEAAQCVEIKNAETAQGGNVQIWERNGHNCQAWELTAVDRYHAAEPAGITGDFNGDGKVNAADFTYMKRTLLTNLSGKAPRAADANGDGTFGIADAVALQKFLIGEGGMTTGYYAAINAAYLNGVEEATNAGFRDTGYVNLDNVTGSFLEFSVFAPEAGTYTGTLGIANGSDANRIMQISANGGTSAAQDFNSTGAWTQWTEISFTVPLRAGSNTIRLTSATEQGGPNIDYLMLKPAA